MLKLSEPGTLRDIAEPMPVAEPCPAAPFDRRPNGDSSRMPVSTTAKLAAAAAGAALLVRVVHSRRRRFLHPAGRSFGGTLEVFGAADGLGSTLLDRPARHRATVRVSKGAGTPRGRADIRGVAVRVHLPGRDLDLLLSTAGNGRLSRHVPMPRRSFDTTYGSITAYRTGSAEKVYMMARPAPGGPALGRSLAEVGTGDRLLVGVRRGAAECPVGLVSLEHALPATTDGALAFDPVRNSLPDLHPTGLIHGVRAYAYRLSQRWRGATPPTSANG